jgi:hypothetical protein
MLPLRLMLQFCSVIMKGQDMSNEYLDALMDEVLYGAALHVRELDREHDLEPAQLGDPKVSDGLGELMIAEVEKNRLFKEHNAEEATAAVQSLVNGLRQIGADLVDKALALIDSGVELTV